MEEFDRQGAHCACVHCAERARAPRAQQAACRLLTFAVGHLLKRRLHFGSLVDLYEALAPHSAGRQAYRRIGRQPALATLGPTGNVCAVTTRWQAQALLFAVIKGGLDVVGIAPAGGIGLEIGCLSKGILCAVRLDT